MGCDYIPPYCTCTTCISCQIISFTFIADSYVLQVQKYEVPSTHSSVNSSMKLPSVKPVTTPSKMSVSMPPKSNTPSLSKSPISAGTPLIKMENEATPTSSASNQKPAGGTQVKLVRGTTNAVQGSAGNSQALSLVRVQNNQAVAKSVGTPTSATSVARGTSKPQQIVMVMSPGTNKGELGKVTFTTTQTVTLAQGQKTYTAAELNQIIQLSQQGTALKIVSMANQASSSADTSSQSGVKLVQRQANGQVIIKMVSSGQSTSTTTVSPSSTVQTKTLDVTKIKVEQSNTTSLADSSVSSTLSTPSTGTTANTTAGTADSTVGTIARTTAGTTAGTITGTSATVGSSATVGASVGTPATVGTTFGKTAVTTVGTTSSTGGTSTNVITTTGKTIVTSAGTTATSGTTNRTIADTTTADTTTGTIARTTATTVTSSTQVISSTTSANQSSCTTSLLSTTGTTTLSSSQTINKATEQTSNSTAATSTTTSTVTSTSETGNVSQGPKVTTTQPLNTTISKPPTSSVSNAVSSSTSGATPDSSGKPANEQSEKSVDTSTPKLATTTPRTIPSSKTEANGLQNNLSSQSITSTTSTAALAGAVTSSVSTKSDLQKIASLAASTKLENPATVVSRPVTCGGTTTQQSTAPTTTTSSRDMGPPASAVNSASKMKSAARTVGRLLLYSILLVSSL